MNSRAVRLSESEISRTFWKWQRLLKNRIHISTIVNPSCKKRLAIGDEGSFIVKGPYRREPRLTTGQEIILMQDSCWGRCWDLIWKSRWQSERQIRGFYVRKARSASFDELQNFIID